MEDLLTGIHTPLLFLWVANLSVVIILTAYYFHQEQKFSFRYFLCARAAQSLGWFLFWLRGVIPFLISGAMGNALLYMGWAFEALALLTIRRRQPHIEKIYTIVAALGIVLSFGLYFIPDSMSNLRTAFSSSVPVVIFIVPALMLITKKGASALQRTVGLAYLISITASGYRSVTAFLYGPSISLLTAPPSQTLTFLDYFAMAIFGSIGYLVLDRETVEKQLMSAAAQVAVMEERARLSHDLHDSVTQSLYSLNLNAKSIPLMLKSGKAQEADALADTIADIARQALMETRLLMYELRPCVVVELGLIEALRQRLDIVESRGQIKTQLHINNLAPLDVRVEDVLYHIAIEALNNVLKHANAREVKVVINIGSDHVTMAVQDNGIGYKMETVLFGAGIHGMRERAVQAGGSLNIHSEIDNGTNVTASIPISTARQK